MLNSRVTVATFILVNSFIFGLIQRTSGTSKKPHIFVILADDLGWNDVGFHGSNEIPTPNIDAIAYNGITLNKHYTAPVCTPSRAALMTGKYPMRMGMQGRPLINDIREALPITETILPQYLKKLGYVTRLVGKWHLGFYQRKFTPTERGFDSFFGHYCGWVRYNDSESKSRNFGGIDARQNHQPAGEKFFEKYNTDVLTDEAVRLIREHDTTKPLFMDLSYVAPHAIGDGQLQDKNRTETEIRFSYIKDQNRRVFAGVLSRLDDSIGRIIDALNESKMIDNTIILFISDNGGETEGGRRLFQNYASNWPLRGMKGTNFEGAVRGVAALWSPFTARSKVFTNLMHLTDWLPTFYKAAGGDNISNIDGIDQWDYLTNKDDRQPRSEIVINIEKSAKEAAIIDGDWKLAMGANRQFLNYYGSSGREKNYKYDMNKVLQSTAHMILSRYNTDATASESTFQKLRSVAQIDDACSSRINEIVGKSNENLSCYNEGCLYNLESDPCEYHDLSKSYPSKVVELKEKLQKYTLESVERKVGESDPRADPKNFNGYWTSWLD